MDLSTTNFIPTDIFYLILEHLTDRRDLYAAALTSRDFNRAATPLLYRTLDTDTPSRGVWGHKAVRSFGHFLKPSTDLNSSARLAMLFTLRIPFSEGLNLLVTYGTFAKQVISLSPSLLE
jgi:hypothetical protein